MFVTVLLQSFTVFVELSPDGYGLLFHSYLTFRIIGSKFFSPSPLFKEMSVSISILIYRVLQLSLAATSPTLALCAPSHPFQGGLSQRL